MDNLKAVIQYECSASFKHIWFFYAIEYGIIIFIQGFIGIFTSVPFYEIIVDGLEIGSLIYITILGVMVFKDDFKMLIQNGFTRKYIFAAVMAMFAFISATMAAVDAVVGTMLNDGNPMYCSLYFGLYENKNLVLNWLWLFFLYFAFCCIAYFITLVVHKVGKHHALYLGLACAGAVVFFSGIYKYVFLGATDDIIRFFAGIMGFMENGTINLACPVLTFCLAGAIFGTASYAVIRRTELK